MRVRSVGLASCRTGGYGHYWKPWYRRSRRRGGNPSVLFNGLEAQGEINRLLDRVFGGYD
jgi:hypothetical protein